MAGKRIQISSHARLEMRRRSVSATEVRDVVRHPGQILPSRKGRRIYPASRWLLRVMVKETGDAFLVLTVYKTTKIAKYWRTP